MRSRSAHLPRTGSPFEARGLFSRTGIALTVLAWVTAMIFLNGCAPRSSELSLTTYDQSADQHMIADIHRREAARLRQMSEELTHRILVYERLFGPDSDWVKGTRLLAQTYAEAAQEQEGKAESHSRLAERRSR